MGQGARGAGLSFVFLVSLAASAAAGTLADYRLLILDGAQVKWGAAVLATGATVTYAVTAAAESFPDNRNCRGIAPVDGLLANSRITRAAFDGALDSALAAWSAAANVRFVPGDPAKADILIGAEADPYGRAFTNVSHQPAPPGAPTTIARSVICLNPTEGWKIGFDGNLDVYDLRYTLTHELGHAIGLDHPGVPGVLMDFRYTEKFASLQPGDIAGAVRLYGPAEPAIATAGAGAGSTAVMRPVSVNLPTDP